MAPQINCFGNPHWRTFVTQYLAAMPKGGRAATLFSITFMFITLVAKFTFVQTPSSAGTGVAYGGPSI